MNERSAGMLRIAIALVGAAVFTFMLWEPHIEGRNENATIFQIYFKDPFLAYAYVASIPFFLALYRAFKALGFAGNEFFSREALKTLRMIRICAVSIICFVLVGEIFILLGDSDDRAGGVFMGILITFGAIAMASATTMFERKLK